MCHVSTVSRDENMTRDYIRHQEKEDQWLEQLKLLADPAEGGPKIKTALSCSVFSSHKLLPTEVLDLYPQFLCRSIIFQRCVSRVHDMTDSGSG
jgi:hypothetical protein